MSATTEFTTKELAAHAAQGDCWIAIHGEVYDVTPYLAEHPGGPDMLLALAGADASQAYDDAGHSDDADALLAALRVGRARPPPKPVRAVRAGAGGRSSSSSSSSPSSPSSSPSTDTAALGAARLAAAAALTAAALALRRLWGTGVAAAAAAAGAAAAGWFAGGFTAAWALALLAAGVAARGLRAWPGTMHGDGDDDGERPGRVREPAHLKIARVAQPEPLRARGVLDPRAFRALPLVARERVAPDVLRLRFGLAAPDAVAGLPVGQHVAVRATVDGAAVQRAYTPVSNNADRGALELVVRVYPDGLLTGRYFATLGVGDEVLFRGPMGAMEYRRGLCRAMGMLAGGTGITPMYQVIRAICEDPRDTTEVSLLYANRTEEDILLRKEIEGFARRYPKNLKVYYLVEHPPENWPYGAGLVTKDLMAERFPDPRAEAVKVMLCGPPGMVDVAKKALADLGFKNDQVFCF